MINSVTDQANYFIDDECIKIYISAEFEAYK